MADQQENLTLAERLYIPEILRGLKLTFSHLFRPKVTMEYPEQRWELPPNYRGASALVTDQDGREKCVACFLCQEICPPQAITIVGESSMEVTSRNIRSPSISICCGASTVAFAKMFVQRRPSS